MAARTQRPLRFDAHETARLHDLDGVPLATFRQRALAFAIDMVPVVALNTVYDVWSETRHMKPDEDVKVHVNPFHGWSAVVILVLYFGVLTFLMRGRTPGKALMKARVVSTAHGGRLSLWHSLERALGYGASALEGGFGFIQYFVHPNRRCVHDRIAETIVVDERRAAAPRAGGGAPPA